MEYTDEELMLLEQLTYLNDDVYDAAGISDSADSYQTAKNVERLLNDFGENELKALEAMGDKEVTCDADRNKDGEPDGTHVSGAEWAAIIRAAQQNERISQLEISNITTVDSSDGKGYNFDAMCFNEPGNKEDAIPLGLSSWRNGVFFGKLSVPQLICVILIVVGITELKLLAKE